MPYPLLLTIQLFGPLRVRVRGAELPPVRTRSVLWLLALLTLRSGQNVARSWLAGALWPDSRDEQALLYLGRDLMLLHAALGPEGAFRTRLHRELNAAPDEATVRLFDGIRAAARGPGQRSRTHSIRPVAPRRRAPRTTLPYRRSPARSLP
jgi:hypothetical protein